MPNHRSLYSYFIIPPIFVSVSQTFSFTIPPLTPWSDSCLLPLAPLPPLPYFSHQLPRVAWEKHPLRPWPDLHHTPRCGASGQLEPHHHGLLSRGRGQSRSGPPGLPLDPRGSRWVPAASPVGRAGCTQICGLNLPSSHPLQASRRRSGCSSGPWWWGTQVELSLCPVRSVGLWITSTGSANWRARPLRGFSI